MTRERGLLAFLCTVLAAAAALTHIPVVSGLEQLGRAFADVTPETLPPLAVHLSPPEAPQLPHGPGYVKPVTLYDLQHDQRPDQELRSLAARHLIPFPLLKSHLAVTSRGVLGQQGFFWPVLPEGDDAVANEGLARTRAATDLLSRYWQQTGTAEGALIAWKAGVPRSRRVVAEAGRRLEDVERSLRRNLLAAYRADARTFLCTVTGLALAQQARWPVEGREHLPDRGGLSLAARPGETVRAPMEGSVTWAGQDGSRGICVEVRHACDLTSTLCGLKSLRVSRGRRAKPGQPLGPAGSTRVWFGLRLDHLALDPSVLLGPDDAGDHPGNR